MEITRRKVTFEPSEDAYLKYVFELNCQTMERFRKKPGEHPDELRVMMKSYIEMDITFIDEYYRTYGRTNTLAVPPLSAIPEHIDYTLLK